MVVVEPLLAAMLSVVIAMLIWGLVLVVGQRLIKALKLPTDLPDECRFEPPPPAPEAAAGAPERAALWQQRATICQQARQVHMLAWQATERVADDHTQRKRLEELSSAATAAMANRDTPTALSQIESTLSAARAAWAELEQAQPAPTLPNNRRLVMLMIMLIVMCLWLFIGLPWLRNQLGAG